ncbi:hypothetical protein [Clostridium sp. 001]|uniref:IS1096 element passenger TnpR family protein n=1 Tax=Clostridium sp. 001 TaxID=1970093 RepID=UPI001C2C3A95|nr:hypothetical protein [Clostridium sp. 001]QXE20687.1 hypothetical protein B5S50_18520 [Clostridium sp. 001]
MNTLLIMKSKYEKDILPFIEDFGAFINFILEKDPDLSNKTQVLGKNLCFELNSHLHFQRTAIKASYTQEQYIAIDLFFKLAVKSRLFLIQINNKNKFKLIKTVCLEEFLNLNIYEKYVFLLEVFWTTYDFEEELRHNVFEFIELLNVISKTNSYSKIFKNDVGYGGFFSYYSKITRILRILGICELEFIDSVKSKYDDSIKSIMPTDFGREISKTLITALDYINIEDYIISILKERLNLKNSEEDKAFIEIISMVFEPKLISKTINCNVEINKKGTYILKVLLGKNLWRVLKLSHNTTFHELHLLIQQAFDFDNDHMYAFYTGTSRRTGKELYSADPFGESDEYEELTIEEADIYKGQQFIYLFDFGDMWEFKIQVMDFIENEESTPQIIESKGESPQQYPDWD